VDPLRSLVGDEAAVLHGREFQALLLANLLAPLGTALLSPILDSLIEPFGTSAANIGLMISAVTAPAIVAIPIAGLLSDRVGRKPVLVGSLLLFGAAGTAVALTTDFTVVLALRALQGIAFGGITPVIITSIGDTYDGTAEATAQGIRFTGSGLAQTAFPLFAGIVVAFGWQYPFLVYAIAFPIAITVVFWFEEPTDGADAGRPTPSGTGSTVRRLVRLVRAPRALSLIVARGLPVMIWIGFITYNSIVVVRIVDGTPAQAGMLVAVGSFAYAAAAAQAGRVTAAFDSRFYPLVGANVCLGGGFALFLFAPTLSVAAAAIVVTGIGFGLALSLYRSIVTGLADESLRGSVVSVAESLGRAMATVTPVVMGAVIGLAEPTVGLQAAVRIAGLGIAAVSAGGGVACLVAARLAPPVPESVGST
jgi:MFS family permease